MFDAADVPWRESLNEHPLLCVFPQIPDAGGDFHQAYYTPLPQFIPPSFLPGVHYIPPPLSLNVFAESAKEAHGKELLCELWKVQYINTEMDAPRNLDSGFSFQCFPDPCGGARAEILKAQGRLPA